jgi:predicted glycoside hydrolase/deacetylase ChbG (UPF0249 family)
VKGIFERSLIVIILCFLVFFYGQVKADSQSDIRLIVRGDDLGMTHGSLVAFEKAFKEGILTCASILATAPWFEGAAELYKRNPKWCIGLHLSIIGEWRGYRWRPVLPWDQVPSIVDHDGFLYRYPEELFSHNPKIEQIEAEYSAQIRLALKKGVNVQYLDTHYLGYSSYRGIEKVFEKLARKYNIPLSGMIGEKRFSSVYKVPINRKEEIAIKRLEQLLPGLWLWVTHLGIDSPEQNALIHTYPDDVFHGDGVGKHRAAELEVITSKKVKSIIRKKSIKLTDYRKLWEEQNKK